MFNWEKLELFGITKANNDLVPSEDKIHCTVCGEHIGDHGEKDKILLHSQDISFAISIAKSENDACASLCNRHMFEGNESFKQGHFRACECIKSDILKRNNHGF